MKLLMICAAAALSLLGTANAFAPTLINTHRTIFGRALFPQQFNNVQRHTVLFAQGGPKKKKRRKRKKAEEGVALQDAAVVSNKQDMMIDDAAAAAAAEAEPHQATTAPPTVEKEESTMTKEEMSMLSDVASFQFEGGSDDITAGVQDETTSTRGKDDPLVLPDIRDQLKKKEMEEELARMEEEQKQSVKKIKRSDTEAFTKLLEAQPFADADDSYFEAEEYGIVSALLGEGAKPFLGIPSGFLQVGHFIGALGIVLMAFVQYPGFPLTNLPTPVRECLQGGLLAVYAINALLAVFAVFKAGERGQSKALWAIKTFSVGGLALDQLTQLPTLKQIEEAKSRKGKRAWKKR